LGVAAFDRMATRGHDIGRVGMREEAGEYGAREIFAWTGEAGVEDIRRAGLSERAGIVVCRRRAFHVGLSAARGIPASRCFPGAGFRPARLLISEGCDRVEPDIGVTGLTDSLPT